MSQSINTEHHHEGDMSNKDYLHEINSDCNGCMDGRPVAYKARKTESGWQLVVSREKAANVVEPKLPGGALGFVAVLEKVAGLSQDRAIEVAEQALRSLHMSPQLHVDNDHGHFEIAGKTEAELLKFVSEQAGGCGFAGLIWSEQAPELIQKLKERGWLVEVLDGHHGEKNAKAISREGVAINAAEASAAHDQSFTFNRSETRKVFVEIESLLRSDEKKPGFVDQAMAWNDQKFAEIAEKIGGITNVQSL